MSLFKSCYSKCTTSLDETGKPKLCDLLSPPPEAVVEPINKK